MQETVLNGKHFMSGHGQAFPRKILLLRITRKLRMRILLIRPHPGNERFGLGPFFRVEPLGLEYLGEASHRLGHETVLVDERFDTSALKWARRLRPHVVGIAVPHALEFDQAIKVAQMIRQAVPEAFIVAGGSAAASFPAPLEGAHFDAVCIEDGEGVFPALLKGIESRQPLSEIPGLRLPTKDGWVSTPRLPQKAGLDEIALPARHLVQRYRKKYHCLQLRPVWLIETARGCPFHCNFCSVWQLHNRTCRERSVGTVVEDFAATGENVFVVDDLFWNHAARSIELAHALKRKGIRKQWMLVQSRTDLVARHADLLEAWRPLARYFDIFFGFEAATDSSLESIEKDSTTGQTVEALEVARSMQYGITGNFLVNPGWDEHDFQELWEFVAQHKLQRAGYTILTPLPGTEYYKSLEPAIKGQPWSKYDMNHLLWEPHLGAKRFLELYAETWRRSVLNTAGEKKLSYWLKHVRLTEIPFIISVLRRTQMLMNAAAYLAEHATGPPVNPLSPCTGSLKSIPNATSAQDRFSSTKRRAG